MTQTVIIQTGLLLINVVFLVSAIAGIVVNTRMARHPRAQIMPDEWQRRVNRNIRGFYAIGAAAIVLMISSVLILCVW